MKKTLKIMLSSPPPPYLSNIRKILSHKYNIVECVDADYFIVGAREQPLKYALYMLDKISIHLNTEASVTNFNFFDYAIGFDDIQFGDRYLRHLPAFMAKPEYLTVDDPVNRRFCNFIYSNPSPNPNREVFFHALSKQYKQVDSLGSILKNVPYNIEPRKGDWLKGSIEAKSRYKFSIAFENAYYPGYTSEKIVTSFQARTIPIYWGNPDIHKIVNPESFINCHDYKSFSDVVKRVKELDTDDQKYLAMLNADKGPMDTEDFYAKIRGRFEAFIENIFNQPLETARRRHIGTRLASVQKALINDNICGYPITHEKQAMDLFKQGKLQQACDSINKAIKSRPDHAEYYFIQACILCQMNELNISRQSLAMAIQMDPENSVYRQLQSTLDQQPHNLDSALT